MPLRVVQAFGGHAIGEEITDEEAISAVLGSEQAHFVVAVPASEHAASEPAEPAQADAEPKE